MSSDALSPGQFWHVSSAKNRASIEEHGLSVDSSQDRRHVWLYPDRERAEMHVQMHNEGGSDMHGNKPQADLYEVDARGFRTAKDPHGAHFGNARVVKKTIPASRLKRHT